MNLLPSPFDTATLSLVDPSWEPLSMAPPEPRALIDDDMVQPDGMPLHEISDRGAPLFCQGLAMVFSLRDNGSTLVAHGFERAGDAFAGSLDKKKVMETLLSMGDVLDKDVKMTDPQGAIGRGSSRSGHVCLRDPGPEPTRGALPASPRF